MTLSISFYNGIKYTKDDFLKRDSDFFGNGVVKAEHFPYTLASTPDMTIQIGTGVAWVDGYRIENDAPITFTLQPPSDLPRIDIVQIGHDDFHACAVLEVKTGVPGHTESIPAADPKFVELYAIYVNPGVAGIAAEDVENVFSLVPLQVSGVQISFDGAVSDSEKGQPGGVASLDSTGRVPVEQIPELGYLPVAERGMAEGIATLDSAGLVLLTQLPPLDYVSTKEKGEPNGVAQLGSDGKVPTLQLPPLDYIQTAEKGQVDGVATLDSTMHIPSAQLPIASAVTLGGVKAGNNITIATDGTISGAAPYTLPNATSTQLGGVQTPSATTGVTVPIAATRVANAKEVLINTSVAQTIASYTPLAAGEFVVYVNLRALTAVNVQVQVTYNDSTGTAQTDVIWPTSQVPQGPSRFIPCSIYAGTGGPISISILAATANQIYASASIVGV